MLTGFALVLGRSGNDLLSRALRHSTIGAEAFNGRVRDGIGFGRLAQVTGPAKDKRREAERIPGLVPGTSGRIRDGKCCSMVLL